MTKHSGWLLVVIATRRDDRACPWEVHYPTEGISVDISEACRAERAGPTPGHYAEQEVGQPAAWNTDTHRHDTVLKGERHHRDIRGEVQASRSARTDAEREAKNAGLCAPCTTSNRLARPERPVGRPPNVRRGAPHRSAGGLALAWDGHSPSTRRILRREPHHSVRGCSFRSDGCTHRTVLSRGRGRDK